MPGGRGEACKECVVLGGGRSILARGIGFLVAEGESDRDSVMVEKSRAKLSQYGFYLHPQFSMLSFTSAVEPLRVANRMLGEDYYSWLLVGRDEHPVMASNGIEVLPHAGIDQLGELENLVTVAGLGVHDYEDKHLFAWLRGLARRGCRMGAVSTGSYILARAGLLSGHRCTIHWENWPGLARPSRISKSPRAL